jgi:RNA polymerase sigma-70 factor (ECF subfamily)
METLTDLHQHSFHWALTCCEHQETEALDLLQEAYLLVLEEKAIYLGKSTVKTWFFGLIKNLAFQKGRRFRRRLHLLHTALFLNHPTLSSLNKQDESSFRSPLDQHLETQERHTQIKRALKTLSAQQERVIHLVFYQGCTLDECAHILKIRIGSVRTHYARAKSKLAQELHTLNTESRLTYPSTHTSDTFAADTPTADTSIAERIPT